MISLHFALPEPDHFTYDLVDVEPISLRRSLFNQGANSGDDFARSLIVIHHKGNRIPPFFQVFCIEPAQTGAGIVNECPERLIDFMGDRGSHLSQRRHPRDMSQLHLRSAKCFFGALAFDELANLTAQVAIMSSSSWSGCLISWLKNSITPNTSPPSGIGKAKQACNPARAAMGPRGKIGSLPTSGM